MQGPRLNARLLVAHPMLDNGEAQMTTIFDKLREQFPSIVIGDDKMCSGIVWYDLMLGCKHVTVEFRPVQDYGLYYTPSEVLVVGRTKLFRKSN